MPKARRSIPIAAATVVAVAALAVFLALPGEAPSAPASYQAMQAEYVGSDLCQECHADQSESYMSSLHAGLDWSEMDFPFEVEEGLDIRCESCHGPGSNHVEMAGTEEPGFRDAIISFARVSAEKGSEQCLQCHANIEAQMHFDNSIHSNAEVGCADCHSGHQSVAVRAALDKPEPQLCYDCHGDKRAQFGLPERHPVDQGLMTCTDCHTPHGNNNPTNLVAVGNATCTECHQDKAGPFVFPHPAVETDGCIACHQPHGSVNNHLLNYRQVAFNCLQCHPSQPTFHVQPGYSECTTCHIMIHGSNLHPAFLR